MTPRKRSPETKPTPPEAETTAPALLTLFNDIRHAARTMNKIIDVRQYMCSENVERENTRRSGRMKIVSYMRVSTGKQAKSGLGMEAQRAAVNAYVTGNRGTVLAEYVETESGKRNDRPELAKALAHAKRSGATLLVAKLDRLSRNAAFLNSLLDADVDFIACDNAVANRLTIRILAAVAQEEREAISRRTREALQAAKARGVKLGSNRPGHWTEERHAARLAALEKSRAAGLKTIKANARDEYADLLPLIESLRGQGQSYSAIAEALNAQGHSTRKGGKWTHVQVSRLLKRMER